MHRDGERPGQGRRRGWTLVAGIVLLASCATAPETAPGPPAEVPGADLPVPPPLGFFSRIKTPESVEPVLKLQARGVQVFRCEARGSGYAWTFRLPEADLFDAGGRAVVRHGANFSFEHADGSRLLASVVDFDEAPAPATCGGCCCRPVRSDRVRSRGSRTCSASTRRAACRRPAAIPPSKVGC